MKISLLLSLTFFILSLMSCGNLNVKQQNTKVTETKDSVIADSIEFRDIVGVSFGMTPRQAYKVLIQQGYKVEMGLVHGKVKFADIFFDGMVVFANSGLVDYMSIGKSFDTQNDASVLYSQIEKAYRTKYHHFENKIDLEEFQIKVCQFDDERIKVTIDLSRSIDLSSYDVNLTFEKVESKDSLNINMI